VYDGEVLTADQMLDLHNRIDPEGITPAIQCPFSEGHGTLINNVGSSALPGTLLNADLDTAWDEQDDYFYGAHYGETPSENLFTDSAIEGSWAGNGSVPPATDFGVFNGKIAKSVTFTSGSSTGFGGSRAQDTFSPFTILTVPYRARFKVMASRNLTGSESVRTYITGTATLSLRDWDSGDDLTSDWTEVGNNNSPAYPPSTGNLYVVVHPVTALASDVTFYIADAQLVNRPDFFELPFTPTTGSAIPFHLTPALPDGTQDALGNAIHNPAGALGRGKKMDRQVDAPVVIPAKENFMPDFTAWAGVGGTTAYLNATIGPTGSQNAWLVENF